MPGSDSDESTANSGPKYLFQCPHCQRAFPTRQALCGHQNAHRVNRVERKIGHVTEAHENNHHRLPAAPVAATANRVERKIGHVTEAHENNNHQRPAAPVAATTVTTARGKAKAEAADNLAAAGTHHHFVNVFHGLMAAGSGYYQYQYYYEPKNVKPQEGKSAKDYYIGGRMNNNNNMGGLRCAESEKSEKSSERTVSDSNLRAAAAKGENKKDDEEVTIQKKEDLDLDLKLGFGSV